MKIEAESNGSAFFVFAGMQKEQYFDSSMTLDKW